MSLDNFQRAAGLTYISSQTVLNALHERGVPDYKEYLKPVSESKRCTD